MNIQAIETVYNDLRFRSRLEARWAVFFDALGVEYAYEPEGFELGDAGRYLPDFWLPQLKLWVEIKAEYPNAREILCARRLSDLSRQNVLILSGQVASPPTLEERDSGELWNQQYNGLLFYGNLDRVYENFTSHHMYCLSGFLQSKGFNVPDYDGTYEMAANLIEIDKGWHLEAKGKPHPYWHKGVHCDGVVWDFSLAEGISLIHAHFAESKGHNVFLDKAYKLARTARFEYGETPRVSRVYSEIAF